MKTLPVIDRPNWLPESAWPWPTYALDYDTGRIAVTDVGEGPPLLFVHVGSWSFVWRDVLLRLHHDFRCVTLDAPSSGLSDRTKSAPTLARAADAVAAVIDELQLRDLTLVAHDLGGPAGFLAASRAPIALPPWRRSTVLHGGRPVRCSAGCWRPWAARPHVSSTRRSAGFRG